MSKYKKRFTLVLLLSVIIALCITNSMMIAKGQTSQYRINVSLSSPIQNQTYTTNEIPLSFSYDTNIPNSSSSVVFNYNLDGQPGFDVFGNPVFTGETTRIGQFYQPIPLTYNSSINVPTGKHSLFVLVTFWISNGETQKAYNYSQVVNFKVSPQEQISSPSPSVPELSWLAILPLFAFMLSTAIIIRHRKTTNLSETDLVKKL